MFLRYVFQLELECATCKWRFISFAAFITIRMKAENTKLIKTEQYRPDAI